MKKDLIYFLFYGNCILSFTRDEKNVLDDWINRLKILDVDYKVYKQLDLFSDLI